MDARTLLTWMLFGAVVIKLHDRRRIAPPPRGATVAPPAPAPAPDPSSSRFDAAGTRATLAAFADSLGIFQKVRLKGALSAQQVAGLQAIASTPDAQLEAHLDALFGSLAPQQRADLRAILNGGQLRQLGAIGYPV